MVGEIRTTLKRVVSKIGFETVAQILDGGMANVGSYIQEDVDAFLKENGLIGVPHVFMANHSMGGRDWEYKEELREPLFFAEPGSDGGWYVFREDDVHYLNYVSATSGSSLTAQNQDDGTWVVTLEVPVDDGGQPYKGWYWECFHKALLGLELLTPSTA